MSQHDAVDLTTLYVIDLIRRLTDGGGIALTELGNQLQEKIMGADGAHSLWFTFGPHDSLAEFVLELQALGLVAELAEGQIALTPQGTQLLEARTHELEELPERLGVAA